MYHTSLILVIVCFAQDDAIVSWICCWLVSSTVSFVTSPAHHPISVFFFPGSSPLIRLCLFPFFHCFNASCQIECLRVTTLSFLDYRALQGLCFLSETPPPPFFFFNFLSHFFSFSPETMAPIPKKLLTPNPHLILLRVLMNGEEKSWYPRKGPIVSYCVLLSLCITGSR